MLAAVRLPRAKNEKPGVEGGSEETERCVAAVCHQRVLRDDAALGDPLGPCTRVWTPPEGTGGPVGDDEQGSCVVQLDAVENLLDNVEVW